MAIIETVLNDPYGGTIKQYGSQMIALDFIDDTKNLSAHRHPLIVGDEFLGKMKSQRWKYIEIGDSLAIGKSQKNAENSSAYFTRPPAPLQARRWRGGGGFAAMLADFRFPPSMGRYRAGEGALKWQLRLHLGGRDHCLCFVPIANSAAHRRAPAVTCSATALILC